MSNSAGSPTSNAVKSDTTDSQGSTETATFTLMKDGGLGVPARILGFLIQFGRFVWRIIRLGADFARETVTVLGWLCIVLAIVVLPIGVSLRWIEFTVAGATATILLVIAIPFLFGGRAYQVGFTLANERVVAGDEARANVSVTNVSPRLQLPGRIDIPVGPGLVDVGLPLMRPGQVFNDDVLIPAQRRGVLDIGPVTTVRTDPVGLLSHEMHWADIRRLFIHPKTVTVPNTKTGFIRDLEGEPSQFITDSDISFNSIREYRPGDSRRHVHWRSTAKTGKLMIRKYEETRKSRMVLALALNPEEYASPEEFELSISALASLGVRALRDERAVSVVTSAAIPVGGKRSVKSIRTLNSLSPTRLLDDLSLIESSAQTMELEGVCSLVSQVAHDMSVVFLFCGSKVAPKALQRMRLQLPSDIGVVAVMSDLHHEPGFRSLPGIGVMTIAILDDLRSLMARYSG